MAKDPLANVIAQVSQDGRPQPAHQQWNPEQAPRQPWTLRKLFCGCFPTRPSLEEGNGMMVANGTPPVVAKVRDAAGPALLPQKTKPQKLTLILDLDETLVHSSFQPVPNPDFVIPVEVDGTVHRVFVCKRPGVDEFMRRVGELYEVVVFTASVDKYANPVLDLLDKHNAVHFRLFREACVMANGALVKDLTKLGRDLNKVIIVDNSPTSYMLQPQNAVPIGSWFDDMSDQQLAFLLSWFEEVHQQEDVYHSLSQLRTRMRAMGISNDVHVPPSLMPQALNSNPHAQILNSLTSPNPQAPNLFSPQPSPVLNPSAPNPHNPHHPHHPHHPLNTAGPSSPQTPPLAPLTPPIPPLMHHPMPPPPMGLRV
mmetsp:Transcript_2653/g.4267  ORF Transcript_2653/g.4267 Transcript_2653/m.4267 type:complete len:368 (+) Transcript_2653:35-1138(+)